MVAMKVSDREAVAWTCLGAIVRYGEEGIGSKMGAQVTMGRPYTVINGAVSA